MCGIAGIVSLQQQTAVEPEPLRALADTLRHRGPDDAGFHLDPQRRCGLAFRRLAIIDLTTGHQPQCNEDRTVWVICNGEIYNFRELRADLEKRGHRFVTASDIETIVHLYEEFGERCFEKLAGMFAIALWDERRGELLLARDRLGKKPLVYCEHAGRFYFASEAKAILALPDIPRNLNPRALQQYLTWQYVPAPDSIFEGFQKIPPGSFLKIKAGAPFNAGPQAYWTLPRPAPFAGSYADAKQELGRQLESAVAKRLIADVPLGAFLSGGIDSSIVVGLMRKLGVSPLRTFSIGFPDARYDETVHARTVAEHFGTEHHEHIVTPKATEILETLAYHYDEPFGDSSAIPTYYVSRYTRESVTVALTGDGGDECFTGYDRYYAAQLAARLDWLPQLARGAIAALARGLPRGRAKSFSGQLARLLTVLGRSPAQRYNAWVQIIGTAELQRAVTPAFAAMLDANADAWLGMLENPAGRSAAEWANRADFVSYLPYDLLVKVDIASMACSLECRAPFLDHELVEFALSLPLHWKLAHGTGKHILRDWAADLLPLAILNRPKMGFGVPVGEWFRGELRSLLTDALRDPSGLSRRFIRPAVIDRWMSEHFEQRENHGHRLWLLLMLELWNRRWRPNAP